MTTLPAAKVVELVAKRLSEPCTSKDTRVKLLKKVENALSDLSPCPSLQITLTYLGCSLVQNNLLKHNDDDVKLLVAACFTETIRLLAPDLPFSLEVFKDFFRLIVSVFKHLADPNSLYSARRLKILETIAYCKYFLIMLGGCEDIAAEMFDVFFKAVRCEIPKSLVQAIFSIMTNILEKPVSPRILDVILHNLLRQEKAASFRLAVSVIQDCAPKLEMSVCGFLISCILEKDNVHKGHETDWVCVGGDDDQQDDIMDYNASGVELRSSYHEVILKIYQHSPQILTSMLPFLTQELLIDQVDARMKAVHLIGKLLVLSKLYFGQDHRLVFSEFLRRFSDKSTEVRHASLEWAKELYHSNPSTDEAHHILVAVEGRLLDFDDKVRSQAISVICNLASSNLSYFPSELVLKAMKRLRDKKISVRKSAMRSLLDLYRIYCIKCSNGLFNLNFDYENIPCGVLMLCFDKDCKEFRYQNMELVLARDLFPSSLSAKDRKEHWIAIFSLLTEPLLKVLKIILVQKHRFQHEMQSYLALRAIEKENVSEEVQIKILEMFSRMASSFLDSSKAIEGFQNLHLMKDGYIFKSLGQLLDEHTALTASSSIRVAFLEKIGKKHPDYEFFRILSLRCSYTIFNSELVQSLLEDILTRKCKGDGSRLYSTELMLFIVKMFPSLLKGSEDFLLQFSSDSTVLANEKFLHILAIAGHHVSLKLSDIYPFLEKMCLLGTRAESKFAVQAISSLIDSSDDVTFSNLCKKLVRSLQSGQNIPTVLQSLSYVARCSFRSYKPCEKQVTDYIVLNIFSSTKVCCALEETFLNGDLSCSSFCKLIICGMKALVKTLLPNCTTHVNQQMKETMDILGSAIEGKGIIYNNISSVIDKDSLKLTAVKLLLKFATRFDSYIPPKLFHLLIARARDSSCIVRKAFLYKVHELLTVNLIPNRYACAFALASTDFLSDIRVDSIKYLSEFIGERRRDSYYQDTSCQDEKGQIINSPEYVVIFLIHFLAHDQKFSSENLHDKDIYPEFCSPLVIILRALVDLEDFSGSRNDTLSNLFVIFRALKKTIDAVDAEATPKLHFLSDIAILILKLMGKDLKPSVMRRMVFLPSSFYKACDDASQVYGLSESFVNEDLAKNILGVIDSSIIKSSIQYGKIQEGAKYMIATKDYSAIELNHGTATDQKLKKMNPCAQPCKYYPAIASISTDSHNENSDVFGRRNLTAQVSDANLGNQQLSSCDSASTQLFFPSSQATTTEPKLQALNPLLVKQRIIKCDSIGFHCDENPIPIKCLPLKDSVHKVEGRVGHRVSICSPNVMCSGVIDLCDSEEQLQGTKMTKKRREALLEMTMNSSKLDAVNQNVLRRTRSRRV